MIPPYKLFVYFEDLQTIPKSGKRRQAVLSFLSELPNTAFLGGDYKEVDPETGRPLWVSEVAGFAITWWIDSPVYEVKVVDIKRVSEG